MTPTDIEALKQEAATCLLCLQKKHRRLSNHLLHSPNFDRRTVVNEICRLWDAGHRQREIVPMLGLHPQFVNNTLRGYCSRKAQAEAKAGAVPVST